MLFILAQAASSASSGQGIFEFIQYGVLGLVVVGLLLGWIWAKPAVQRLIEDKEKAENQRDTLIQTYETQVIPLLRDVDQKIVPALTQVAEAVKRVDDQLKEMSTQLRLMDNQHGGSN